jgi:hypothetical protein
MKRSVILVTLAFVGVVLNGPGFAQVPGRGFSVLLCVAQQAGSGPGNAQVSVAITSDTGPNAQGIGQAQVTITHGVTGSTHTVQYHDSNNSGKLDCGDVIISVS